MKMISVAALQRICEQEGFKEYRILSADQPWNRNELSMQLDLTFPTALFAVGPDIICLKGTGGLLYFRHIQYVCVAPVKTVLGMVFDVVCEDRTMTDSVIHYRVLAIP